MTNAENRTANVAVTVLLVFEKAMMISNKTSSSFSPIISDDLHRIAMFVNHVIIGQIVAVFGMGSNLINIYIFCKMGFNDSINISLFGLALSDLLSCMTSSWSILCFTPAFHNLDFLTFSPMEIAYLMGGTIRSMFIKISGCITAYIAFERCLCVTFPLKVKNIITRKRVAICIVSTYVFALVLYSPAFYVSRLVWKFYPYLNKTRLGLIYLPNKWEIEKWSLPIRGPFLTWFLFIFVTICSVVLVVNLRKNSKWRKMAAATTSNSNQVSSRDTKVSTLVVFISVVFIVCYTPQSMTTLAMSAESEISFGGRYNNLLEILFTFNVIFECINACLNIFIYYLRSSTYRVVFDRNILFKKATSGK